jgi:hypothetical protein
MTRRLVMVADRENIELNVIRKYRAKLSMTMAIFSQANKHGEVERSSSHIAREPRFMLTQERVRKLVNWSFTFHYLCG